MHPSLKGLALLLVTSVGLSAGSALAAQKFGAIAISNSTGVGSVTTNYSTRVQAQAAALKACGKRDCQVRAFLNTGVCGAVASRGKIATYALGNSQQLAERKALSEVRNGKIVASACNATR